MYRHWRPERGLPESVGTGGLPGEDGCDSLKIVFNGEMQRGERREELKPKIATKTPNTPRKDKISFGFGYLGELSALVAKLKVRVFFSAAALKFLLFRMDHVEN